MRDRLQKRGVTDIDVQPGKTGQFDVIVDGELKYSRYDTGGFPTDEEVDALAGR